MQKTAAAIGVITFALFAGLAPESRIAAAGRESGTARDRAQLGKLGNAIKLGTKVAARPKFTDEDEGRMAQAQGQKFDAAHKMWPDPLLETYLTGIVQKLVAVAKPRPFPYRVRVVNDASLRRVHVRRRSALHPRRARREAGERSAAGDGARPRDCPRHRGLTSPPESSTRTPRSSSATPRSPQAARRASRSRARRSSWRTARR